MNSRAILLGTGAFPPLLKLWLETAKIWQDEVDKIYIAVDNFNIPGSEAYIRKICQELPKVVLLENCRGWPQSYNDALNISKEDTLLLMHDDTLVYKKGVLDNYFRIAETGKVVTPLHEIYAPKGLVETALQTKYPGKFPLKVSEEKGVLEGREGYSFLLYLLFIKRQTLLNSGAILGTDRLTQEQATDLLGIDTEGIGGDTGFILGLELFQQGAEFYPIPRYETIGLSHAEDSLQTLKQWRDNHQQIFEGGWFHLQNTGNTIPLWFKRDLDTFAPWVAQHHEVRLAWFYLMLGLDDYPIEFTKQADEIFTKVMDRTQADYDRIVEMAIIFNQLVFGGK